MSECGWLVVMESGRGDLFAAPVVVDIRADPPVRRAVPGDGMARDLLAELATPGRLVGHDDHSPEVEGRFAFVALDVEPGRAGPREHGERGERPMLVDQTHESVVVDEQVVVKWAVRAEATPSPTVVAHLRESGFEQMARPHGFVSWRRGMDDVLVASAVSFLSGATDGWTWAVEDAGAFATGASDLDATTGPLTAVGAVVADLHVALATPSRVVPQPLAVAGSERLSHWRRVAERLLEEAVAEVDGPEGQRLRSRQSQALRVFDGLVAVESTAVMPVHGDLHVGQILRWEGGYAVADFDGNPVLPVAERLAPQPAARDVAGMLQAIDHVGRVVDRRVKAADPTSTGRWIGRAQEPFLAAYEHRLAGHGCSDLLDHRLLRPFQVEQECREFLYAARHLPRWRYVPDQALQALLSVD